MGNIKMPSCITKAQGEQVELRGGKEGSLVVVVPGNIDKEEQLFPILPPIIYESDSAGAAASLLRSSSSSFPFAPGEGGRDEIESLFFIGSI